MIVDDRQENTHSERTARTAARDTRFTHPENAGAGGEPWLGDRAAHPAGFGRRASSGAGFALSGVTSAGAQGPDLVRLARDREQPPGQVLRAHSLGAPATGQGAFGVAA